MTLEYGPNQLKNNTLITQDEIGDKALLCTTDRETCCSAESDIDGNWYMPNGSEISQQTTNSTQQQMFYVSRRNQTVELNYANFSDYDVPTGIYHCEIMDDNNVTNHFFVGIYPQNEG